MKKNQPEKKLKTLWLPSWYPSKAVHYSARFIRRHAEAAALYSEVMVLFPVAMSGAKKMTFELEQRSPNLTELVVYYPKNKWKWLQLCRHIRASWMGFRRLSELKGKPDLLHLHVIFPAGISGLLLSLFYRLPLIVTEHWTGYRERCGDFKGIYLRSLAKLISWQTSSFIALSTSMAEDMRRCGIEGKYWVVPNVVEINTLPIKPKPQKKSVCHFIHVSSLEDRHKNISGILRAVKKLSETRPVSTSSANRSFHLTMVGGDEGTEPFVRKAAELGISHLVHFTGMLPHPEVMLEMGKADVFVMFSNFEGLPCVALEALCTGMPVIATETGGMHEWLGEEQGILLKVGDEPGLINALEHMIDNWRLYDPEKISSRARALCNYESIGSQFLKIYRQALSLR